MKECTCKEDSVCIWSEDAQTYIISRCPVCEQELQELIYQGQEVQKLALRSLADKWLNK